MKIFFSIILSTVVLNTHCSAPASSSSAAASEIKKQETSKKYHIDGVPRNLYEKFNRLKKLSESEVSCQPGKYCVTNAIGMGWEFACGGNPFGYRGKYASFAFKLAGPVVKKEIPPSGKGSSFKTVDFIKYMNRANPQWGISISATNSKPFALECQQFCHPAPDKSKLFAETETVRCNVQKLLDGGLKKARAEKQNSDYSFIFDDEDTRDMAYSAGYESTKVDQTTFDYGRSCGTSGEAKYMLIAHHLLQKAQKDNSFEYVADKEGGKVEKVARINILDITPASIAYWLEEEDDKPKP